MYRVTKTYGHEMGLSTSFRQWRAESHCRFIHGYALSFKLTFEAPLLDKNNWVIDFGGLKEVKAWLISTFDHRMLVAADDPQLGRLLSLGNTLSDGYGCNKMDCPPLSQPIVVDNVGCESFANMTAKFVLDWMDTKEFENDVRLVEVEAREHSGNSAIWLA